MQKNLWYVFGTLALIGGAWYAWPHISRFSEIEPYPFELRGGDAVASWSFQGAYTDKPELIQKALDKIEQSKGLLGSEGDDVTDYELYVSIANQYELMGDGANELLYLRKALAVDAEATGLAWHNMGVLLERLKAYTTARFAFEQAVKAQPIPQYQNALAEFLAAHRAASN